MYSLLRACNIVRSTDNSEKRLDVFRSVLQNSRKIRWAYQLYQMSPASVQAALVVVYGLKCFLSIAMVKDARFPLLFFGSYPNERHVLDHVRRNLDTIDHGEVTISLRNCLRLEALPNLLVYGQAVPRLYVYARKLVARHSFMPACRIFSVLGYYIRYKLVLANTDIRAVFVANQYSPECLGLVAVAHQSGMKVLFTNHANATIENTYVPPIYADLVAVTSRALADIYQRNSPKTLNIVPLPMALPQRAIRVPTAQDRKLVAGIYLTALTDLDRLQFIASELISLRAIETIFIRPHPAAVVTPDLSGIVAGGRPVEVSNVRTLSEDIARTDLAIVGSSTVAVELLRGGRPVFYDDRLDGLIHDYNGYLKGGLVPAYPETFDETLFGDLAGHYLGKDWVEKMRYFDVGYQQDEAAMLEEFRARVTDVVLG